MKHIVSFSGGKDSTAMLLMMLEKGMPIDDIIFCDTGAEFPAMYEHIKQVEKYIKRPITILKAKYDYEFYLLHYEKKTRKGEIKKGLSFPDAKIRWCTAYLKRDVFKRYLKKYKGEEIKQYIGIAYDEPKRIKDKCYPLYDWQITEKQALEYCYSKGFTWGGLYKNFNRVSCWCCPLKGINELRKLRKFYPDLWDKLKDWQTKTSRKFTPNASVFELEERFAKEDRIAKWKEENEIPLF